MPSISPRLCIDYRRYNAFHFINSKLSISRILNRWFNL